MSIKLVDFVNKIDITQTFTPVDLSKDTVVTGGGSFTITGAAATDWYEYRCSYDTALSTLPSITEQTSKPKPTATSRLLSSMTTKSRTLLP